MTGAAASAQSTAAIHRGVDLYYTSRLRAFGPVPLGVDWTCQATQELRFVQLLRLVESAGVVSLNDLGCGYGALYAFCKERFPSLALDYLGVDLSAAMVRAAKRRWRDDPGARFARGSRLPRIADYSVASGIFNVKLRVERDDWERTIQETLREMKGGSRKGMAVNFLAPLPADRHEPVELYRAAPDIWAGFCRQALDAEVEVLAGYGLREFTLLVRF